MAETSEKKPSESERKLTLTIELSSFVLLALYIAVTALQQSDTELVLPYSKFDVGGVLEQFKDGIPGGTFLAPILKVQVPLALFYTVAPILLVLLHALVVLGRGELLSKAPPPLRFLAIWLPPATIAVIRWRFAPFVSARPTPPLAGQALEGLHSFALFADAAVVAVAILLKIKALAPPVPETLRLAFNALKKDAAPGVDGTTWDKAHRYALYLRAARHGAIVAVIAFLVTQPLRQTLATIGETKPDHTLQDLSNAASSLAAAVGAGIAVMWLIGAYGRSNSSSEYMEELDMTTRAGLAAAFILFVALPTVAHGLDFSGESLVARAPSETMVAALIAAQPNDLVETQMK